MEDESRPSKIQHCWDRSEYWEESWRRYETYCPSDSNERPSATTCVNKSHGAGRVQNWKTDRDHPKYSIVEIGQNTEKSPGDVMRLTVPQNPVKDHQLTLVWKTLKNWKKIKNTRTCLLNWNVKEITESLLIATKNNVIRTNYVKAKIHYMQ